VLIGIFLMYVAMLSSYRQNMFTLRVYENGEFHLDYSDDDQNCPIEKSDFEKAGSDLIYLWNLQPGTYYIRGDDLSIL
jgi:hypothetical protein